MIFSIVRSDAGIEDGIIECVVDVVGGLVVKEQRHRQTAFVWQVRLYGDVVQQNASGEVDLTHISSLIRHYKIAAAVITAQLVNTLSPEVLRTPDESNTSQRWNPVLLEQTISKCHIQFVFISPIYLSRFEQGNWIAAWSNHSIDNNIAGCVVYQYRSI